ncbi:alba DNA/RNA-binding protein [Anaeramoeba flamelloides]|uniref:Alba DNA/RNA-binding protein n=1 Tax=Anaeramoeba flamelloides TaxID=1746091 RepID=A0ABQ8X4X7_9EUKA|nr:alba DNA/RNA-binding protein [Anaeramoeba flamelloides]
MSRNLFQKSIPIVTNEIKIQLQKKKWQLFGSKKKKQKNFQNQSQFIVRKPNLVNYVNIIQPGLYYGQTEKCFPPIQQNNQVKEKMIKPKDSGRGRENGRRRGRGRGRGRERNIDRDYYKEEEEEGRERGRGRRRGRGRGRETRRGGEKGREKSDYKLKRNNEHQDHQNPNYYRSKQPKSFQSIQGYPYYDPIYDPIYEEQIQEREYWKRYKIQDQKKNIQIKEQKLYKKKKQQEEKIKTIKSNELKLKNRKNKQVDYEQIPKQLKKKSLKKLKQLKNQLQNNLAKKEKENSIKKKEFEKKKEFYDQNFEEYNQNYKKSKKFLRRMQECQSSREKDFDKEIISNINTIQNKMKQIDGKQREINEQTVNSVPRSENAQKKVEINKLRNYKESINQKKIEIYTQFYLMSVYQNLLNDPDLINEIANNDIYIIKDDELQKEISILERKKNKKAEIDKKKVKKKH